LPELSLIILAAGKSSRFSSDIKKQWIRVGRDPLWKFVADRLRSFYPFKEIIITADKDEIEYMRAHTNRYIFIKGGNSRQESVKNALSKVDSDYLLVTDVARACVDRETILELIENYKRADIIVPALDVVDTVVYDGKTIDRERVKLIQTPQLSKTDTLKKALSQKELYSDDSSAIKAIGGEVFYTKGSKKAKKITIYDDLRELTCLKEISDETLVGFGYDVHRFIKGDKLYLCGVEISSDFKFLAHSDGDVAIHALIDALLGGIGAGDIGELFPDSDEKYKDISSKTLLHRVVKFIKSVGFEIVNVDIAILCQTPKISPYKAKMREVLSDILKIEPIRVNIKATTTEKLGFVGRSEGVAVKAVASLKYKNWKESVDEDINSGK
jgi:2-C-methyl-D-erythritol 4-phosphate cytidylyltransferase/2-C-methyl-D-erythritol 2,4-cyclodiphosphate synthase